jgi:hypothetical protein
LAQQRPSLSKPLEQKISTLILAGPAVAGIKALFQGEPGFAVPVKFHPFYTIHFSEINEARGQQGYGESTGMRYYRYDGYISCDVTLSDIRNMTIPSGPFPVIEVPSYNLVRGYIESALDAVLEWAGPDGRLDDDPVISADGKERSVELLTDTIRVGLARRSDSVTNRGSFEFVIYTRRMN